MDDTKLKNIRVSALSPYLKNNAPKSFAEILNKLQTGSIVNGLVLKTFPSYKSIIQTAYGRIIVNGSSVLHNGDKLTLKITDNSNLQGSIIAINEQNLTEPETVEFHYSEVADRQKSSKYGDAAITEFQNFKQLSKVVQGSITYLNLDKLDTTSALYKELQQISDITEGSISVSFKIKPHQPSSNPFSIEGEVSFSKPDGSQLIKTAFGVISVNDTGLVIGTKVRLDIITLNGKLVEVNMPLKVSEFFIELNKTIKFFDKFRGINYSDFSQADVEDYRKLATTYRHLKELLMSDLGRNHLELSPVIQFPAFSPQNHGLIDDLSFSKPSEGYLRFIFTTSFESISVRFDGLVKTDPIAKKPINCDLILWFDKKPSEELQSDVAKIFTEGKKVFGLSGHLQCKLLD